MSGVFLAVTIDCECDKDARWRSRSPLAFDGVREGVGRRLAPLFRAYGAKPTYLLSPEVLRDAESVEVFASQGTGAELGTHLHGEYAEPGAFEPEVASAFQRDYPAEIERAKLAYLTDVFRCAFGRSPRSFRAGRFGVGAHSMGLLESLGYVVDSSVTPHESWENKGAPGLSFRGSPTQPYRPSRRSPGERGQPGESLILEVPVTIRPHPMARVPLLGRALPPRWLRPSRMPAEALVDVAREEVVAAGLDNPGAPVVLNAMFHNVEVIPGASPYAGTEQEAKNILDRVGALLAFAARESIKVVGLSDVAELFA
jgi:hypothetical protein